MHFSIYAKLSDILNAGKKCLHSVKFLISFFLHWVLNNVQIFLKKAEIPSKYEIIVTRKACIYLHVHSPQPLLCIDMYVEM